MEWVFGILVIFLVIIMMSSVNNNNEEKVYEHSESFFHVEGIPGVKKDKIIIIYLYPDKLIIKIEFDSDYVIPMSNIKKAIVISEEEIIEKQKSVILRGIAGGILLGPIGAIVGAISGAGTKKSTDNHYYFSLEYENDKKELSYIVLKINTIGKYGLGGPNKLVENIHNKINLSNVNNVLN